MCGDTISEGDADVNVVELACVTCKNTGGVPMRHVMAAHFRLMAADVNVRRE